MLEKVRENASKDNKDTRKQQLIDATIKTISRYGLSGTTVSKVAKEAQLSVGIINFYFESKEKLLLGTLEFLSDEFKTILSPAFATEGSPDDRLIAVIRAYFQSNVSEIDKIAVWWAFCSESSARKDYTSICGDQDKWFRNALYGEVSDLLKNHNPDFTEHQLLAVSRGLEGIIDGFWQDCLYEPEEFDPEHAFDVCMDYLSTLCPASDKLKRKHTEQPEQAEPADDAELTEHMPRWAYFDEEFLELEKQEIFKKNWLLVGHVNDMPNPKDFLTLDAVGERAIVIRNHDGKINAFHNVCRHRGAKLKDSLSGTCENALMCPFHGWTFQLDGTLVGVPAENTFPDLDKKQNGLTPLDMEIWMGFVFIRFQGDGPSVSESMQPLEEVFNAYQIEKMVPLENSKYEEVRPYNWKIIHDIDNEGYHVPIGHPSLQQLYGKSYVDSAVNDMPLTVATLNDEPGKLWSVRNYQNILPSYDHLPEDYRRQWLYGFTFPTMVFGLYPESIEFYMTIPVSLDQTIYRGGRYGLPDDSRETRVARYLNKRINQETEKEDESYVRWLQDGMLSSAFPEPNLSSIEAGVQRYHNEIQHVLPVAKLKNHPGKGRVAEMNRQMLEQQMDSPTTW